MRNLSAAIVPVHIIYGGEHFGPSSHAVIDEFSILAFTGPATGALSQESERDARLFAAADKMLLALGRAYVVLAEVEKKLASGNSRDDVNQAMAQVADAITAAGSQE